VVHLDGNLRIRYVVDHLARFDDFDVEPVVGASEAAASVLAFPGMAGGTVLSQKLGITVRDRSARLIRRIVASGGARGGGGMFEVDARTGVTLRVEPEFVPLLANVTFQDGTSGEVEVSKLGEEYAGPLCDGPFCAVDTTRGANDTYGVSFVRAQYEMTASVAYAPPAESKIFASADPSDWSGTAPDGLKTRRAEGVSALHTMARVWDWYASEHGWNGISNDGAGLDLFLVRSAGLNAFWNLPGNNGILLIVEQPDDTGTTSNSFSMSPDVMGHEYTHGVLAAPLSSGGMVQLENANDLTYQSRSVTEGLCDTMGNLLSDADDPGWRLGEHGLSSLNTWLRNDSNPGDAAASTWGDAVYDPAASCQMRICSQYPPPQGHEKDCPFGFGVYQAEYVCATLIPYPAWKMTRKLGAQTVGRIYFHVIDEFLGQKAKLDETSQFVFDSCNDLYPSTPETCCVVAAAMAESNFRINTRGFDCAAWIPDAGAPDGGGPGDAAVDAGTDGASGPGDAAGADALESADGAAKADAETDAQAGGRDAGTAFVLCGQYSVKPGYQDRACPAEGEMCDKLTPLCGVAPTCTCRGGRWNCPDADCPDSGVGPDAGAVGADTDGRSGGEGPPDANPAGAVPQDSGTAENRQAEDDREGAGGCGCTTAAW
jgi:hypothetical protein